MCIFSLKFKKRKKYIFLWANTADPSWYVPFPLSRLSPAWPLLDVHLHKFSAHGDFYVYIPRPQNLNLQCLVIASVETHKEHHISSAWGANLLNHPRFTREVKVHHEIYRISRIYRTWHIYRMPTFRSASFLASIQTFLCLRFKPQCFKGL